MRDPVDRMYSVYKLQRHYGGLGSGTLEQAIEASPNLGGANRYAAHLESWFESFGRDNVLVTIYDELRAEPQAYLNRVCDFIGIARVTLSPRPDLGSDINSFARAPKNRKLARRATAVIDWLNSHQAYRVRFALRARRRVGILPGPRRALSASHAGAGRTAARALPARSRGARKIARHRSLRMEKTARGRAIANGGPQRRRSDESGCEAPAAGVYGELGRRPHRHHLAASRARGPRRSALRRQGDAVLHHLLRQGHRLVRAAFSLRDRRAQDRRDLPIFFRAP